jgi:hypothetical protein
MKQSNSKIHDKSVSSGHSGRRSGRRVGRHEMNRHLRRFLILVLLLLMSTILFAAYASLYPVAFTLPAPLTGYDHAGLVNYEVNLIGNPFTDQSVLGMDQVYLRDFTQSVKAAGQYHYHIDQASSLQCRYRVEATVRARDAANPAQVLLTRQVVLVPETAVQISGADLNLNPDVLINLKDYDQMIADFKKQTSQAAAFDVVVTWHYRTVATLPFGSLETIDTPSLEIPLDQAQFRLTRSVPAAPSRLIFMPVTYRLVLAQVPFPVYPGMAGACLILLLVLLLTTRSHRKSRFKRQLRKMLRLARSRLMIIGDKAWEPEWCVTATDFRSLVRTARKLKHPIFCYIDKLSPASAAYFYVYYGENNYCFTFTDAAAQGPSEDNVADEDDNDTGPSPDEPSREDFARIPLLPETDDSPEIQFTQPPLPEGYSPRVLF